MLWTSECEDEGLNRWVHPCLQEGVHTYSFRSVHLSVSWAIAPDKALPMCSIAASSTGPFPGPSRPGSKQQRQNSGLVISLSARRVRNRWGSCVEPGGWAPRHPLVHRSGTVRAGALPTALHRAPCPPQSRHGWAALQPG